MNPNAQVDATSLYGPLLSDDECGWYLSDQAQIRAMLNVEGQLALAQADVGLVPQDAADAINQASRLLQPEIKALAKGTASAGVPVPALVKSLKATLSPEYARWVHFGATSQDIVDTALVFNCREMIAIYRQRLLDVLALGVSMAKAHRGTLIAGRTRTQQAVPISLGLKVANWLAPLNRQMERLDQLAPRLLKLQLGGAVGSLAAMGPQAAQVVESLAARLQLNPAPAWHSQRDSLVEFAGWLAMTTGALGKMAEDWLRMTQTEVGELRFRNGGGSSTMPQKCNPVNAEIMMTMASRNALLAGQMQQCLLHEHERSGSAWTQEWLALPPMLLGTAVSLRHGIEGFNAMELSAERIETNIAANNGVIYAEAATFALAEKMSRDDAENVASRACQQVAGTQQHLFEAIKQLTGHQLDVQAIRRGLLEGGATKAWIDDTLLCAERLIGQGGTAELPSGGFPGIV
jgi:3-carboxy-cis,cis-muconate cycloisomerase